MMEKFFFFIESPCKKISPSPFLFKEGNQCGANSEYIPLSTKGERGGFLSSIHFLGRQLDGLQNFRVARAAAKISRDAIAALRGAEIGEGVLQWMRVAVLHHAFNGDDFGIHRLNAEHQTGEYRLAVDKHRAGAAFAELASVLCSGESHVFAQNFQQGLVKFRRYFVALAIDVKA